MRRDGIAATGAAILVTAALAGALAGALATTAALAECARDLDRLNATIDTLAGQQGETVRQEQLQTLRQMQSEAQRLHAGNDDAACTDVVRRAMAMVGDIAMPQLALSSDLGSTAVVNPQGEQMGKITDLIVDMESGRVAYAILSLGGFLGIGEDRFPVPWDALQVQADGKVVLPVEKERLKAAPRFSRDLWPEVATRDWQAALHRYYGLQPPGWARSQMEVGAAQPGGGAGAAPAQLQQQLGDLRRQISDLSAQMNQLSQQVAAEGNQQSATASQNAQQIQALSDQLNGLKNQVGGIDQQAVNEQITALQRELDKLRQSSQQPGTSQANSVPPAAAGGTESSSPPPSGGAAAPPRQQQPPQQ